MDTPHFRGPTGKDDEMKSVMWVLLGVIGGFIAAHFLNKDPRGHELLAQVDARITEFSGTLADAFRDQEARLAASQDD